MNNLTMNEIIEKDTQMTEVVDEQISHKHKYVRATDDGITVQMCKCGIVGDETNLRIK